MTTVNSILVIVDPTAKQHPCVDRATWVAGKTKASVELFICEYDQYLAGERFFDSTALKKARQGLLDRHRERLEKLAAPIRADGIDVKTDAVWDHPLPEGIVRKAESCKADLLIKDTHFHSALRRSIFSNTDWNLIRDCTTPLWLVKPHENEAIAAIGAAVDPVHEHDKPASLDHKILRIAAGLASATGARLEAIHAFDPAPVYAVSADAMSVPIAEPMKDLIAEFRRQHSEALDALAREHGIDADHTHLEEGEIRETLVAAVEDLGIDLMVMGAVSRSALKRFALGSTAERVLDFIPCDLLIVKPDT